MLLDDIKGLKDYKSLNPEMLPSVAKEIRQLIIDTVSVNGGHLASNLGAVELTMALHYVLEVPKDRIIFDVGHQCYTHKILTGRRNGFGTLRKKEGISGFPNPDESDTDLFYQGHASCAIGQGVGIAHARRLSGEDYRIAVVTGDGALTGGLAFEALNNAAELKENLTIILNDNKMSIDKNVGGISVNLASLRTSSRYTDLKEDVTSSLEKIPGMGEGLIRSIRRTKNGLKQIMIPGMFFEEMGIMYLGPVDGHNLDSMIKVFKRAFRHKGPVVVHVVTQKGRGYNPAKAHPQKYHGTGPFDKKTGNPGSKRVADYTHIFAKSLVTLGRKNDRICAITAAMTDGTGLRPFKNAFPERTFDVGIAEEVGILMAQGLAKEGFIPVVAMYSTFMQRSIDQVMMDICLNKLHVVFALDRAGIVGQDGATHQGLFDISYLSMMPGMEIMAPKNAVELNAMLDYAVNCAKGPVAIRYPRGTAFRGLRDFSAPIETGKSEEIYNGGEVSLLALGSMVETALEVREILAGEGIEASLTNMRFAKPIDMEALEKARKARVIVTLEENVYNGGFGMAAKGCLKDLGYGGNIVTVCIPDKFIPHGEVSAIKESIGLDAASVAQRIREALGEEAE